MKIFLVEDDEILNNVIVKTFEGLKYEVNSYYEGSEALLNVNSSYDLYLLDINLPNVNGLEILKKIKKCNNNANIFIISGELDIKTILNAYNTGCNDFIKKPFDIREIIAKIQNSFKEEVNEVSLAHGGKFYRDENKIVFGSKIINLTKKEAQLMSILIKYKGKSVSNTQIEMYVWGESSLQGYVRQLVSKLRAKLPYDDIIENNTLSGYKLKLNKSFLKNIN